MRLRAPVSARLQGWEKYFQSFTFVNHNIYIVYTYYMYRVWRQYRYSIYILYVYSMDAYVNIYLYMCAHFPREFL